MSLAPSFLIPHLHCTANFLSLVMLTLTIASSPTQESALDLKMFPNLTSELLGDSRLSILRKVPAEY